MDEHSTDVDIQVSVVTEKLKELLSQEVFVHPRLRREVRWATSDLHEYLRRFRDSARKHKTYQLIPQFELRVLQDGYLMEDITDTFIINRLMLISQRQEGFIAKTLRPLIRLSSVWSQNFLMDEMRNVRLSFITFWNKSLEELATSGDNYTDTLTADDTKKNVREASDHIVGLERGEEALVQEMLREGDEVKDEDEDNDRDNYWHLRVIPVVGIAGSGKTTLASRVYDREDIRQHFRVRAWVRVSAGYNLRDILIDMCKQVTGAKQAKVASEQDYFDLRKETSALLRRNRYLVVMDDVWSAQLWDQIRHVFPDTKRGSRILVTTCDNEVARLFSSPWNDQGGEIVQTDRLSNEDTWALFLKKMRWDENRLNVSELTYLKTNVLRKCDGSPLAVTKLCGLLSTKSSEYHELLRLIDEQVSAGDQDQYSSVSSGSTLSYQNLPYRIRPCYLYMGLFPRAFEIPLRRLFRLWIAEGLVGPELQSFNNKTPEDLAEDYFKELVSRNLIEVTKRKSNGRPKMCRIPGILHDVFSTKAADLGLFFVHRYSDNTSARQPKFNVRRLAEHFDIKNYPSSDAHIQHLRSYICFNTRRRDTPTLEVGIFLDKLTAKRGFGLLRVLDLESVYKPALSESLGKLLQLRYLGLRWTFLDSLTESVGGLLYLETLDVKHTNITNLPSSIWKAKNLRHLYMNEVHFNISVRKRPSDSLTNLQTLWGLSIGNRSQVVNWLSKLVGLRKLGLTCHPTRVQAIAEWISNLTNLQSLKLRSIDEFGQPLELKLADMRQHHKLSDLYLLGVLPKSADELLQFPPNLKILTLSGSQLAEDSIRVLGELPQLNILRLYGRSYSGKQIVCRHDGFPELLVLKLWMLDELTEWRVEKGAMPRLRELEIRRCLKLKHIDGVENLTALKDLTLTNMPADFVQNVDASMGKAISIKVHEWEFSSLQG